MADHRRRDAARRCFISAAAFATLVECPFLAAEAAPCPREPLPMARKAFVYRRGDSVWTEQARLTSPEAGDRFATSVGMEREPVAV